MRQVLGSGALGRPRGIGWRGRWEGGSGWGIHVYPWLIHVNVWQKPLQYFKVISFQLIKKKGKKKEKEDRKLQKKKISKWYFAIWLFQMRRCIFKCSYFNFLKFTICTFLSLLFILGLKRESPILGLLGKTGTKTSHSFNFLNSLPSYREHNSPSIPKSFCKWSSFLLALAPYRDQHHQCNSVTPEVRFRSC